MEQTTKNKFDAHNLGRLLFLGVVSLTLASFFPLLAPFPLVLAFLLSGRLTGTYVSLAAFVVLGLIASLSNFPIILTVTYVMVIVFGLAISEIFFRNIEPIKGIKFAGWTTVGLLLLLVAIGALILGSEFLTTVRASIVTAIQNFKTQNIALLDGAGKDADVLKAMLDNPDKMIKEIIFWSPSVIFATVFISIWASVLMILRNSAIWKNSVAYKYNGQNVLKYKTPEYLVFVLIAALVLMLGGEILLGESAYYIGGNILYCLSVFYFFQGFGIYLDLLTVSRIRGLIRAMLIAFTIVMAWRVLVLVGVFDLWFDFRKFLRKRKNEGDIL